MWGFRWDREDMRSPRWWPQGITTSADSATGAAGDDVDGRQVLMTSAYSHEVDGVTRAPG